MPKWVDLKPLPEHVVAPLLRALACIPRSADTRLLLRKAGSRRPPGWDGDAENDFDVMFRERKQCAKDQERSISSLFRIALRNYLTEHGYLKHDPDTSSRAWTGGR